MKRPTAATRVSVKTAMVDRAMLPRLVLDVPKTRAPVALLLRQLPLYRRTKVVDVGANPMAADAAHSALLKLGGCDVVGFEPQPAAFDMLAKIKSDRESYYPFAIGDGRRGDLRVYQDHGFTSFLDPYLPGTKVVAMRQWHAERERIPFETVTLDSLSGIGPFDLLKIDVQGGERDVLRHGAQALKTATVVIVELRYFRLYENEPMIGGVDAELRAQGFELHKILLNRSRALRNSQQHRLRHRYVRDQLIDGDAVYLRDISRPEDYSDEQLVHLAIMASSVFESHSLVLFCLDELARRKVIDAEMSSNYVDVLPAEMRLDGDVAGGGTSS